MATTNRIAWLSVLRGLNILLVVMFHTQLIDLSTGENHAFCHWVSAPFTPLRIPLFIFISGGLLYLSRIRKEWSVGDLYMDKAQRILVPFLFFVVFYFFMKIAMGMFVKTPVECSLPYLLECFVIFPGHSSAPLWFLATLSVLMLMYPLFCWLCKHDWAMIAFMLFSCAIYFIDFTAYVEENYFYLFKLNNYLVFFFAGIFFFRYKLYEWLDNLALLALFVVCYGVSHWFEIPLLTGFLGILMMCSLCMVVARWFPGLFSSFSEYIFQIYLMSVIFQAFVELILWQRLFYCETLFPLFYVLNVSFGIFFPVVIAKLVKRCPWKVVRLCFGLK